MLKVTEKALEAIAASVKEGKESIRILVKGYG